MKGNIFTPPPPHTNIHARKEFPSVIKEYAQSDRPKLPVKTWQWERIEIITQLESVCTRMHIDACVYKYVQGVVVSGKREVWVSAPAIR